jgi:hypothetical protein
MILNSPYISGSLTVTGNEVVTGSLTVLGGITGAITGSATSASYAFNSSYLNNSGSGEFVPTGSFNTFSSSILSYTASNNTNIGNIHSTTASLNTFSGSTNSRLSNIESTTASLNTASGSAITRLSALEVTSGSNITRISALEAASGSAITRLSALEVTSGSNISRLSSLESKTGSYATTGSNTFVGGQYISQSSNPTGFTTTASLYTDGGLRVSRDAYISGTLYLNNVTVFGTQSVAYISSSQLNIGTNLITVNTDTPSIRFGGLAVYDSGSTGLTGSILWDSQNNHWIYSNPSGSSYSGGMFISGPRTSTLGSETGTTSCMLLAGQGGDHLTSSMIYHSSTVTCIPTAIVGGSTACFASTITSCNAFLQVPSTAAVVDILRLNNPAVASSGTRLKFENGYGDLAAIRVIHRDNGALADDGQIEFQVGSNAVLDTKMTILNTGNVGIGTLDPIDRLMICGEDSGLYISNSNRSKLNLHTCGCGAWQIETNNTGGNQPGGALGITETGVGSRFHIAKGGVACFQNTVCAPQFRANVGGCGCIAFFSANGNIVFDNASISAIGNMGSNASQFSISSRGCLTFRVGENGDPSAAPLRFLMDTNGIACFACQVCAPSFIGGTVDGSIINSTSNAFRFSGNNALSLVSLCSQNVVKINAAGYWGVQLVGANDQGILVNNTGNVGIGTAPFSWASGWRALEVGASGVIAYTGAGSNDLSYTLNSYFDSSDNRWEYRYTGDGAARYSITALTSEHRWFNAPVGTANTAISWTQAMTLTSTGNLGIGTSTPCASLHVVPTASNSVIFPVIINNQVNCATSGYGVGLRLQNSTTNSPQELNKWAGIAAIAGGVSGYSNDTDLAFYVGCFILASNCTCPPVEKMRIQSSTGNVGIGTTSPCAKLHIQGTGALQDLLYFCTGGSVNTKFVYSIASGADDAFVLRRSHTTQGELCIMSWTYNGLVGIGTTTPAEKLDIVGPNGSVATMRWRNEGGRKSGYLYSDSAGVAIYDTNLNDAGIYLAQNSQIDFRVGGTQKMRITCGGTIFNPQYVGGNLMGGYSLIGTISPGNTGNRYLHVRINTVGSMMYWIKLFGYVYTTNVIEGLGGGYVGGGTGNVDQAFQNGSIVAQYQNNGYIEIVVDTVNTATTNRWGSITFLGGTDTIATVQPLEIMTYSWTSTITRVY